MCALEDRIEVVKHPVWSRTINGDTISITLSSDGETLATVPWTGRVRLFSGGSGESLGEIPTEKDRPVVHYRKSDGCLLTLDWSGLLQAWDIAQLKEISRSKSESLATSDGIFGDAGDILFKCQQGVSLIDLATGKTRWTTELRTRGAGMIALSPDGQRLAVNDGFGRTIRLLDAVTSKLVANLDGHSDVPFKAAFSPDANWLMSISSDRRVILWNGRTGELKREFICPAGFHGLPVFSADSTHFIAVTDHHLLGLFDRFTGIAVRGCAPSAPPPQIRSISYVGACFSKDGKQLICATMRYIGRTDESETRIDCWDLAP